MTPFLDIRDSSTSISSAVDGAVERPEGEIIWAEWYDHTSIKDADSWAFDVFDFVKTTQEGYLVKLAGYVIGRQKHFKT